MCQSRKQFPPNGKRCAAHSNRVARPIQRPNATTLMILMEETEGVEKHLSDFKEFGDVSSSQGVAVSKYLEAVNHYAKTHEAFVAAGGGNDDEPNDDDDYGDDYENSYLENAELEEKNDEAYAAMYEAASEMFRIVTLKVDEQEKLASYLPLIPEVAPAVATNPSIRNTALLLQLRKCGVKLTSEQSSFIVGSYRKKHKIAAEVPDEWVLRALKL